MIRGITENKRTMKQMIETDLCPCRSGKTIELCHCLQTNGDLIPLDVSTSPPLPQTGYAHPKCYAGIFQDCSHKISGEHFVSESILKELCSNGGVRTSGMRWMDQGESKIFSVNSLQSNVLCTRHNSVLSGVDTVGWGFFCHIRDFQNAFNDKTSEKLMETSLFNGHDVERWMLKVLCGLVASKNHSQKIKTLNTLVPEDWLRVLYGLEYFTDGFGIYYVVKKGDPRSATTGISINVVWDISQTHLLGLQIGVNNMNFFLAVKHPGEYNMKTLFPEMDYRLAGFSFTEKSGRKKKDKNRKFIMLGWRLPHNTKARNIIVDPRPLWEMAIVTS